MSEIQLKLEEKYAILNGVRLPRPVFNLDKFIMGERLTANLHQEYVERTNCYKKA